MIVPLEHLISKTLREAAGQRPFPPERDGLAKLREQNSTEKDGDSHG